MKRMRTKVVSNINFHSNFDDLSVARNDVSTYMMLGRWLLNKPAESGLTLREARGWHLSFSFTTAHTSGSHDMRALTFLDRYALLALRRVRIRAAGYEEVHHNGYHHG